MPTLRNPQASVALAGIVGILVLGAGVASAHTVRYDSEVIAGFAEVPGPVTNSDSGAGADYFSGDVISPAHPCEAGRTVRVFRKGQGSPSMIFLTTAGPNGFWKSYREDPANGTYYARAARRVLASSAAHLHVCRHSRSEDFVISGQPG